MKFQDDNKRTPVTPRLCMAVIRSTTIWRWRTAMTRARCLHGSTVAGGTHPVSPITCIVAIRLAHVIIHHAGRKRNIEKLLTKVAQQRATMSQLCEVAGLAVDRCAVGNISVRWRMYYRRDRIVMVS